ncbi:MAG: right-handed parallel beta-helix repeat-containing protein [Nitrospinae bacterium]|nr:right-handed parallel beta-helix repeat-containing protein [Nitrospinota bacterium]
MNKIISTIIGFIFFGSIASAQLTEFSQGDILSAGAMNQNFKYLEDRIAGINETTVDCGTDGNGAGINKAIRKGFNSIVIKGICKENISFNGSTGSSIRLLKLRGANNDSSLDKIVDNSSYSDHVLKFNYGGMLVTIDNLTISGGDRGITTWMNIGIRIRNSKIEGYKNRGLTIQGSSVLEAENLVIDGSYSGASSEEQGLRMWGESNAYIDNLTVSNNQNYGITLFLSSIETNGILNLSNNSRAINVGKGASFTTKSKINISGSSNRAINVSQGLFQQWDGTLDVTNTSGIIFRSWQGKIQMNHLKANGLDSNQDELLSFDKSLCDLRNIDLKDNPKTLLEFNESHCYVDNITISGSKSNGLELSRHSNLTLRNALISNNDGHGVEVKRNSYINISNSIIKENNENGIDVSRNSYIDLYSSTIKSNKKNGVSVSHNSTLDFGGENSDTGTVIELNEGNGVDVYNQVIVEFDGAPVTLKSNTGKQIQFGANTETYIPDSTLNTTSIDCWYRSSQDPNDSSKTLNSGYPIIGFENKSGFSGTISSNCRVY